MEGRFRILFVDDEQRILDGLRRTLRREDQWTLAFACGADEALSNLATDTFDVIVSDLRMPGMDGLALLEHVRAQHPALMRVLLSGDSAAPTYDDARLVAHQFLAKPCDPVHLRTTLTRARALRAMIEDPDVPAVVGRVRHLLSAPRTYWELARLLERAQSTLGELVAIVERDAGLTARVLQLANSAFFSFARPTRDVTAAVQQLGTEVVRGLALAVHLHGRAASHVPRAALEASERRALLTASVARRLAPPALAATAFTAGLLLEVGALVLLDAGLTDAGIDPDHVAAYLLGAWGLPPELVEAVACHRAPATIQHDDTALALAVHVAAAVVRAPRGATPAVERGFVERCQRGGELAGWLALAERLRDEAQP